MLSISITALESIIHFKVYLLDNNSLFQRRVQGGNLKGEMGHPKRLPGQTDGSYIDRMFIIEETKEAVHYRKIKLDTDYGKKNHI